MSESFSWFFLQMFFRFPRMLCSRWTNVPLISFFNHLSLKSFLPQDYEYITLNELQLLYTRENTESILSNPLASYILFLLSKVKKTSVFLQWKDITVILYLVINPFELLQAFFSLRRGKKKQREILFWLE